MMSYWLETSVEVISFLQSQLGWLTPIMRTFTFLGSVEFYLIVMPLLVWSYDYRLGVRLGVMLMLSGALNTYLKIGFRQPRPYWISTSIENLTKPEKGFGLPSGHSQNSASLFGLLASSVDKKWLKTALYVVIAMVALSRLFLGVHSILDIAAGLAVGLILLWLFIKFELQIVRSLRKLSPLMLVVVVLVGTVLMVVLGALLAFMREMPLPVAWLENTRLAHPDVAIAPFSIEGVVTSAGALCGLVLGFLYNRDRGGFVAGEGTLRQHILRFVIGLVGVLAIWKGLDVVFPTGEDLAGIAFRYIRYALVGLWITGFAPQVFLRLKLAQRP